MTQTAEPRWGTPRTIARPTRGNLDARVADLLGWQLFPWQRHVADVAGEYDPATKLPSYRTVGVSVARQNGKTTLICARIARQLILPRQVVAYTAQDRGLARTKWDEHVELLMASPAFADRVERMERTNHRECLWMDNGSRYMPVTPTSRKAGRSLSIDLAVLDEAHAHGSMGVIAGIQPAMAAKPHAQLWLLSNAGSDDSKLWRHYTDVGRLEADNPGSSMAWVEYAPEDPESTDQLDHLAWAQANPSMGLPGGVLTQALSDSALTMDRETFYREHLNVWTESSVLAGIDAVTWAACRRDDIQATDDVAFALDFTPERDRGCLAVAGIHQLDDGEVITPIELIEAGADLDRIVSRAAEVANRWDALITIDRGSPATSAVPALERLTTDDSGTHRVRLIPQTEMVRACGDFHDAALAARISHRGDYRLADAVQAATKRRVGESWAWQRRGQVGDITPLMAATLARWGVLTAPELLVPQVW